jgi:hypothetical protein
MLRRSLSGRMARILMAFGLAVALLSTMRAATASPIHDPGCGSLRVCIANEARYEFSNDDGHKYEHPAGSNCNFFSTQWHAPTQQCDNGMYTEAWCMDFVHWVYKQEGASVTGLGSLPHLASSAKVYGENHGTWHPNTPHVGDMALWNTNEHVEIVVSVNWSTQHITTISGNWSDQISQKTEPWSSYIGFASPVAA